MKKIIPFLIIAFLWSCSSDSSTSNATLATLTTAECNGSQIISAVGGGTVTTDGGAAVTQRGVCWSTQHNPTIVDNKTSDGSGTGTFSSFINGLSPSTVYYVRAYATNSMGTAYGNEVVLTTGDIMYFPPTDGSDIWETKSITDLGWNQSAVQPLLDYLELKHSKSFIILVNGRIVMENYFNGHSATTPWYWASAGKTLTSAVTGIAQQGGYLSIYDKVSDHIGTGWTNEPLAKENLITCQHLLTMTSGIDDYVNGVYSDDVTPSSLNYKADAGTRWAYSNVYVKLQDVVAQATGQSWSAYFTSRLRDPIGMTGSWIQSGNNSVYWSTSRSMARFGLLMLNDGRWNAATILDINYLSQAVSTSQSINQSYGYLWWLNGQSSYHLPQSQFQYPGSIIPSGPNDMYMALGKNDQKIYVIPSKKMVIIRMGEAADNVNLALSDFDETLWTKINALIN